MSATITLRDFKRLTEKEWQEQIMQLARILDWLPYHTWNSMHSTGGFPDLVLVRDRLVMAELKSEKGNLSIDQIEWLKRLKEAGVECYVWRPSNFDQIVEILSSRKS